MLTRSLLLTTLVLGAGLGALAQQRVKPKGPADFDTVYAQIGEHWKAGRFGPCYAGTRELLGLVSQRRAQAIRAAMPDPEGYTREPAEETDPQATAMMAALTASVGTVVEQRYQAADGRQLRVTVTADSPMLQMFRMVMENPAMLQKNQELIRYEGCNAVLESQGDSITLRLLIDDNLVEADFQGADADHALKVFDQKAVTRLRTALLE